ncbi:UDP-N-acetylenolpyruvoylglucosamine reductase [Actinomyces capricornis]|uniref:UDP-N-acetylenolpyruvoylglucosamine reductase n=2 Tax=Actinomyces capricornis TaxID=2755559 RepID=A0ABN6K5F7_9ACTO|nr:UDP-N-acetylmuramate dehydrogenase [Actinomyces capricornis]BDA64793.1 UDP-N-acetylenolpyruvoylglucosamine reductase [Actinomyces capricornis]
MTQPSRAARTDSVGRGPDAADACLMPLTAPEGESQEAWPAAVAALARPLGGPAPTTLAEMTTLRVGGPIGGFVEATTEAELIDAVRGADDAGTPLLVIGGGSNILASDAGFEGLVVRDARQEVRTDSDSACGGVEFTVTAGTTWDDLVRQAIASHWAGFAPLSGIPGTVGAAPVQNIGAYGAEVSELLASVRAWDRLTGRTAHLPLSKLALSYRDSALKRSLTDAEVGGGRLWGPTGRWVVLEVGFHVRQASLSAPIAYSQLAGALGVELGERVPAARVREAVLELRRSKGMVLDDADRDTWSAGSFFTNPILTEEQAAALPEQAPRFPVTDHSKVVLGTRAAPVIEGLVKTSAAWLIDHAGFTRGFALGGAGTESGAPGGAPASLSTKHVLALTNRGGATAADIAALRDAVVAGVQERYGVTLVPEPVHVGW